MLLAADERENTKSLHLRLLPWFKSSDNRVRAWLGERDYLVMKGTIVLWKRLYLVMYNTFSQKEYTSVQPTRCGNVYQSLHSVSSIAGRHWCLFWWNIMGSNANQKEFWEKPPASGLRLFVRMCCAKLSPVRRPKLKYGWKDQKTGGTTKGQKAMGNFWSFVLEAVLPNKNMGSRCI